MQKYDECQNCGQSSAGHKYCSRECRNSLRNYNRFVKKRYKKYRRKAVWKNHHDDISLIRLYKGDKYNKPKNGNGDCNKRYCYVCGEVVLDPQKKVMTKIMIELHKLIMSYRFLVQKENTDGQM